MTALLSKAFKAINNRNRKDDRILRKSRPEEDQDLKKIKTCRKSRPAEDQDLKKGDCPFVPG